jgi:hypothetical protein
MYSYHLWVVLSESTEESDFGSLDNEVKGLRSLIDKTLICKPKDCIHSVNHLVVFQCSGSANHRGEDHDALLTVLRHITKKLPGSYGLVYWLDDENPGNACFDGYRVIVIARGQLLERFDPFLSPTNPTIED